MEKMEGNGMRKLLVGRWEMSHQLEGDMLQDECVGHHLKTSQITQDKTSNLRGQKPQ